MKIDSLLLISGQDIPVLSAGVLIHQPTLKEIALIGEENFLVGYELLNFSKNLLSERDKIVLKSMSDFEILLSIIDERIKNAEAEQLLIVKQLLTLLFKDYEITIEPKVIVLRQGDECHFIGTKEYEEVKAILKVIIGFVTHDSSEQDYNPVGRAAEEIANKLKHGRAQAAKIKNANNGGKKRDLFSRFVSILAVGEHKDINALMQYTLYQLYDEFERFQRKMQQDIHTQALMAGATNLDKVENWMDDIHSSL